MLNVYTAYAVIKKKLEVLTLSQEEKKNENYFYLSFLSVYNI